MLLVVVLLCPASPAQEHTPAAEVRFTERSPLSALPVLSARLGWPMRSIEATGKEQDYDLSKESFTLYASNEYDGHEPWGLFVWVSAGNTGRFPEPWLDVLEKHKLLAVGANGAGNDRAPWIRLGLALDAAHNLAKQYRIDPHRIFIAGGSGGGRCASMLGVCYPDVFEGGFYLIGCNFYRPMGPEDGRPVHWNPDYQRPIKKYFTLATRRSRHVLLTGDDDMNREQTHVYYNGFVADRFRHVTYLQVPGAGHALPDAEWFKKGLALLEPQPEGKEEPQKVAAANPAPVVEKAPAPQTKAATAEPSEPEKLLKVAKLYITNRRYDGGRVRLRKLIDTYPTTSAATEARKLLKEIEGKS
jgi:hypothetical protein